MIPPVNHESDSKENPMLTREPRTFHGTEHPKLHTLTTPQLFEEMEAADREASFWVNRANAEAILWREQSSRIRAALLEILHQLPPQNVAADPPLTNASAFQPVFKLALPPPVAPNPVPEKHVYWKNIKNFSQWVRDAVAAHFPSEEFTFVDLRKLGHWRGAGVRSRLIQTLSSLAGEGYLIHVKHGGKVNPGIFRLAARPGTMSVVKLQRAAPQPAPARRSLQAIAESLRGQTVGVAFDAAGARALLGPFKIKRSYMPKVLSRLCAKYGLERLSSGTYRFPGAPGAVPVAASVPVTN